MGPHLRRVSAIVTIVAGFAIAGGAAAAADAPAPTCDQIIAANPPTIDVAYAAAAYSEPPAEQLKQATDQQKDQLRAGARLAAWRATQAIQLGTVVSIHGTNLDKLFSPSCSGKSVVLYLNGLPMTGLTPQPRINPAENIVQFTLSRNDQARINWSSILGSPMTSNDNVAVSLGFADGYPLPSANPAATTLPFKVIPVGWFLLWAVFFLILLAVFLYYTSCTNIIRDPSPASAGSLGLFSLSRLQGAWWFFVIVASYLFIGIITGDFSNSINSTALILLGIGAGTVVGSAAIDSSTDTPAARNQTAASIVKLQAEIRSVDARITQAQGVLNGGLQSTDPAYLTAATTLAEQSALKERLEKQLGLQQGQSQGLLRDILSDANGISFHRFQIAAFTVILSVIFIVQVYQTLAMPVFNTTLMGLLGLSAGTYLGLKIPEAKTPT